MLALIALSGLVACIAWGRWRWRRGFASAKEIASYDVLYWRAECERVQAILHDVPSDIVTQAMYATVLPKSRAGALPND